MVFSGHHNGEIRFWCVQTGECVFVLRGEFPIKTLLVTADGSLLVGCTNGHVLRQGTDAPYNVDHLFALRGGLSALAATDQLALIGGDNFGGLAFHGPEPAGTSYVQQAHCGMITALCVANNDEKETLVYSGAVDGVIKVWHNGELLHRFEIGAAMPRGATLSLSSTPSGSLYGTFGEGHVARWGLPWGERKCALKLTALGSRAAAPLAFSDRGLLFSAVGDGCHVAYWHIGDLTSANVRFLKQVGGSDESAPVACDGAGTSLGDGVYGEVYASETSRISCLKVVELGWPDRCAVLVTGHEDGRIRMSNVARWKRE